MNTDIAELIISAEMTIEDAISRMDSTRLGIVLVVDTNNQLMGTITDGDLRRVFLGAVDTSNSVVMLLEKKLHTQYASPITGNTTDTPQILLEKLLKNNIRHLPIIDKEQRVVALTTIDDFTAEPDFSPQALIMAGGFGTRLSPLTDSLPKPMLTLGDKPLLEILIDQLREAQITKVNVSVFHEHKRITEHFGDGDEFGVDITYVTENEPLGTAGCIKLMENFHEPILVINGDILTQIDFRSMINFHKDHGCEVTLAVQKHNVQVPYGVIECREEIVTRLMEKPSIEYLINGGIYIVEPSILDVIPENQKFDMTDVINELIRQDRKVVAFPIREYWIDIGQHADYEQAQEQIELWNRPK